MRSSAVIEEGKRTECDLDERCPLAARPYGPLLDRWHTIDTVFRALRVVIPSCLAPSQCREADEKERDRVGAYVCVVLCSVRGGLMQVTRRGRVAS